MQSSVETISDLGLKINISVPANKFQNAYSKKLNEVAKTAKVDGFRPGKVPVSYVKKIYGKSIEGEIVDNLLRLSFEEVCKEKNINVAGIEKVDVNQQDIGKDLEFTVCVETFPEVKFADSDFSNCKVEKLSTEVTDKDVNDAVEKLRKSHAEWEVSGANSKAKMGDMVTIDFSAVQDGEDLESGSADDFELELGSKYLIPGFEEGVVGHKVNDEFELNLKFPADYHAKEHADKDVKFTVTLKEIKRAKLPELNEEFLAKFGITSDSDEQNILPEEKNADTAEAKQKEPVDINELVAKFKEKVKESLTSEVKNQVESKFKGAMFDALREAKNLAIPKSLVEAEITDMIHHQQDRYRQQVGDKNATLNLERSNFTKQAEKNVHLRLLVRGFIDHYDIKTTREQVKAKLGEVMGGHDISDDLLNWYYSEPQRLQQIEALALEDMVTAKLSEMMTVTDKKVTFEELL